MALVLYEAIDSRDDLEYGAQGGGVTLKFHAVGSDDEAEVYAAALLSTPTYYIGFVRQNITTPREGPGKYRAHVRYGTTGLGGGDQPTGSTPTNPTAPAGDTTPLGGGYSFQTTGATVHLTQSLQTISMTGRGVIVPTNFKRAIGVQGDKVEGVDVPAPSLKWSRTVARATLDRAYMRTIKNLTGKVNNAPFYGSPAGTVRYLGADGNFTTGENWSVTHQFEENENETLIDVAGDLEVPAKDGWDYLWVAYAAEVDGAGEKLAPLPNAAYVERVSKRANFALIEIGS